MVNVAAVLVTNWNLFPGLFDGCAFLQQIRKHVWAKSVFNLRKNIPLISLSSISAFENLDASHSSHGTSHSLKPTPIGYVGNLTNSAPSTEAIPNACSRNWLRPSPWSNVGLAKIPKAFRPSGRGRSVGGEGVGKPESSQQIGDTQTVNLIDHGRKLGCYRPYPFIPRHAHLLSLVFL